MSFSQLTTKENLVVNYNKGLKGMLGEHEKSL